MHMSTNPRLLATQLLHSPQIRYVSTSTSIPEQAVASGSGSGKSAFPWPTCPRPTPHQIFHLDPGASQKDIKLRYYELVRIHHPDAPACRHIPPAERHSRFQSLSTAYDALRGRRTSPASSSDTYEAELARRRRRSHYTHAHTGTHFHGHGHRDWRAWSFDLPGDNDRHGQGRAWDATDPAHRWKDRVLLITGGLALAVGLSPMIMAPFRVGDERHRSAVKNLSEARADAREFGMEQRKAIRQRVADDRRRSEEGMN